MSMWAFMLSWFTPTSLFLFVNLMIGIIVLSSHFGAHKRPQHQQEQEHGHQLVRVPSLLERVRSINFSPHKFEQPYPEPEALRSTESEYMAPQHANADNSTGLTRTPSLLDRLKSMDFSSFSRSEQPDPDTKTIDPLGSVHEAQDPSPGRENLVHRSKSDSGGVEENEAIEDSSPATARVVKTRSFGGDESVDAKADDFINRFKQQLRLQRLDSLLRYKEMLKRA